METNLNFPEFSISEFPNIEMVEPRENIWQDRFVATAIAKEALGYKDVRFVLFQPRMTDEEAKELLIPLGFSPDDEFWPYLVSQAEETFTAEQIQAITEYLTSFPETEVNTRPAVKPNHGYMGVGAIPVGGGQDCHMFCEYEDYPLHFVIYGYYDIRDNEETDARRIERLINLIKNSIDDNLSLLNLLEKELSELIHAE